MGNRREIPAENTWLIQTKLSPSIPLGDQLERASLIENLDATLSKRTAVVHAPAGYGKTSLLACWREELVSRNIRTAWLSLDDYDRDVFQFLSYLIESLRVAGFFASERSESGLARSAGQPWTAMLSALLVELGKTEGSGVIILDDFHRAESIEVCRVLNQIVAGIPGNVHLVISTRQFPSALSLADLRIRDELVEFDRQDLGFDAADINNLIGKHVPSAESSWFEDLRQRTEGWPIAINVVRRWIRGGASIKKTLQQLSGRSADLSDYFFEQVMQELDDTERDVLIRTSILERVTGDLVVELCDVNDGWVLLESFERRELFVQAIDNDRQWYRHHRLFSEYLQERLRRQSGDLKAELHRKAANWFAEKGLMVEAVQHAVETDQSDTIASLIEGLGGWHYALLGHLGIVQSALAKVPDKTLAGYPRVWLAKIFLTMRTGKVDQALREIESFGQVLEESPEWDDGVRGELTLMQSILYIYSDHRFSDADISRLKQLSDSLPHDNSAIHAARFNVLCAAHALRGEFDDCLSAGDQAIRHYRSVGSIWGETFIYFHEGYACLAQGRLRDAEVLYRTGYDMAVENFGEASDLVVDASAFLAEVEYEKNNIYESEKLVQQALANIDKSDAWLEVYVAAYVTGLRVAYAKRDQQQFAELLAKARSAATRRGLPRLRAVVEGKSLEISLRDPDFAGSLSLEDPGKLTSAGGTFHPFFNYLQTNVRARVLTKGGREAEAIALLREAIASAMSQGSIRSVISHSVLLSTVLWSIDETDEAVNVFESALSRAVFEGSTRVFIDEGEPLMHVVDNLTGPFGQSRRSRLRDRFLHELSLEIRKSNPVYPRSADELSPRELQVLRYLVQGRSNREIAESASVSINTVKFHLKNIFDKFGVKNRKDAVAESIRRGLN